MPTVKADALERIMNEDKIDFLSSNEHVYGPSVSVESFEINRFGYLARQFDSSKLLITSASDGEEEIGSCPYLLVECAFSRNRSVTFPRNGCLQQL